MSAPEEINKKQILIDNTESVEEERDIAKEKLRTMYISGGISLFLIIVIVVTLPFTVLSIDGLMVYATILALMLFLFALLFRYASILVLAYLYITKYSVEEKDGYYPFISIMVPAYNEGVTIRDSVESLVELDYPNFEVIIINDGSKDETGEIAETMVGYRQGRHGKIKVSLMNKPNGGKAKALNAGIRQSKADFVLCVDGDAMLSENSLKMGARHFIDPSVGAVAGNVKVLNRGQMVTDLQALEYVEGLNLARAAQGILQMVNIIPGPIGFFRKKAIQDGGFYTSDTFAEDADMTLKILSKGWRIVYEPNAISYTEAPNKLIQLLKQRYRWTRGIIQAIRKHRQHIYNPTLNFNNSLVLWAMAFESLAWPAMNILGNLFFHNCRTFQRNDKPYRFLVVWDYNT